MENTEMKYAGFWIRLLAATIDTIIVYGSFFILNGIVMFLYLSLEQEIVGETFNPKNYFGEILVITFVVYICIQTIRAKFLLSNWQATPGKKLLNLKIVKKNGEKLKSIFCAFGRELAFVVFLSLADYVLANIIMNTNSINFKAYEEINREQIILSSLSYLFIRCIIYLAIWFLPIVFTKQKTAVHDMIFKTRVIYSK